MQKVHGEQIIKILYEDRIHQSRAVKYYGEKLIREGHRLEVVCLQFKIGWSRNSH